MNRRPGKRSAAGHQSPHLCLRQQFNHPFICSEPARHLKRIGVEADQFSQQILRSQWFASSVKSVL